MNLEQAVQENTAAIKALTAALGVRAPAEAPKADTAKPAAPAAPKATAPAKPATPPAATTKSAQAATYDDIKKAANALIVKHGRESFMKVLEGFQLPNAMAAKPEQYTDLLAAILKASA